MIAVLILAAVLLAFVLGTGVYLFFTACGKGKQWDWLDEKAVSKTSYKQLFPYIQYADQWLRHHNVQDVYMQNSEGLRLRARWVPAEHPRGTILLAHGYRSTVLSDFSLIYEHYHSLGLNLLLPDQRAHGKSEGRFITFGVKESQDFLEWGRFHNEHLGTWPIIFSGLSMGASTVMYLADEPYPENTVGIIADCGFTSPKEIISVVFRKVAHLPAWPVFWVAELCARVFGGFSLNAKSTERTLAKNKLPIILVHGLADDFVPCYMTRKSYEACAGPKELLLVEGAGHGYSFLKAQEEYLALVKAFLDRVLEEQI